MASPIYGVAFLNIQPDLKGFGASLTRGVGASTASAGAASGVAFGKAFIGGLAAIGIGRVIASQISASIDESIKFESAFAGVLKTVDGTVGQIDQLRTGIIEMSKVLPASREEIAGVAEAAGQLGIETENILEFTKVMIDLGETTDLTADQAATAFAQIANVMKTPQTAFENMASTLVDLGNKGASTESQIIDFAQRMAGAGEIAGLAESDILAIGSAMASVGVEAEAGGTAVQKVLLSITQAVATTNDDLNVFAETAGLSAQAFAKAWEEDAAGAFTLFVEGLGRAGDGAFQILEALELQDQRLIRAFLSLAGAGDLLATQIDIGTQAWDDNSAASEEANKRYETSAARLEVVKNRATELQRQFGDQLVPIIVDLAEQHIPSLENAFKDLTTAIPGEADALDFINFLSDIPRGVGVMVDGVQTGFNVFSGLVEGFSSVLTAGLVGDTGSALDRITGAWEDFAQNNVVRTATQSMIQALREGEDSAVALSNALAFVGRRGKIDPKVVKTLSQIADVDPSQLVLELERLVELGPELGLEADEITTLGNALIDLGPPSIEAIRQQNLLARGGVEVGQAFRAVPRQMSGTVEAMLDLQDAAEAAGVSVGEFILANSDVVNGLLETLGPADDLAVRIGAIRLESDLAAEIFVNSFTPALVDASQALTDLNDDGQVTINEFIESARKLGLATLNFVENLNKIEDVSPELAAKLSALPLDQGALLAQQIADDLERVPEVLDALNLPEELGATINDIVLEALQIARKEGPDAALDFVNFVNLLPLPKQIKEDIIDRIQAGLVAAQTDLGNIIEDTFRQEDAFNRAAGIGADVYDREIIRRVGASAFLNGPDIGDMIEEAFTQKEAVKIAAFADSDSFSRALINAAAADRLGVKGDLGDTIAAYFEVNLFDEGAEARATFMAGLSAGQAAEETRLRNSLEGVLNNAIQKRSPPKLFLDAGIESNQAFWSGFYDASTSPTRQIAIDPPLGNFAAVGVAAGESFVEGFAGAIEKFEAQFKIGPFRLGPEFDPLTAEQVLSLDLDRATPLLTGFDPLTIGQLEELVREAGASGGISIGQFTVQNPIGEPTEESVQSALLEVAISPMVNRLVSPGSSI